MKKAIALILAAMMMFGLVACGDPSGNNSPAPSQNQPVSSDAGTPAPGTSEPGNTDASAEKGDIVWGLGATWNSLFSMAVAGQYSQFVYNVFWEPLVSLGENGIVYRAAESIDISEDGRDWTIHLNPACTWTDGVGVTAEDWVWTLNCNTDPDIGTQTMSAYYSVLVGTDATGHKVEGEEFGVVYVDEYTFEIHFKNPMTVAAFCGIHTNLFRAWPKHLLGDIPVADLPTHEFWSHPVGNGVCVFVDEPVAGQELVLQARPDGYYLGELNFNYLTFMVVDKTNAATALLSGELDTWYPLLSTSDVALFEDSEDFYIDSIPNTGSYVTLILNNQKYDTNVRKAIDMLLDKELINTALQDGKAVICGDNCPPTAEYYLPYTHTVDVEGAKALLDQAGWNYDDEIEVWCTEANGDLAIMIQQMCLAAGLKIKIQYGDSTSIISGMRAGDIYASISSDTMYPDPTVKYTELCASNSNGTMTRTTDPRFEELCEKIAFTNDLTEKNKLLQEYQKLLREECPEIFLYIIPARIPVANHLDGTSSALLNTPWTWSSVAH